MERKKPSRSLASSRLQNLVEEELGLMFKQLDGDTLGTKAGLELLVDVILVDEAEPSHEVENVHLTYGEYMQRLPRPRRFAATPCHARDPGTMLTTLSISVVEKARLAILHDRCLS